MWWMLAMLAFVPASIAAAALRAHPLLIFILSALAVVPLAGYIGQATEELAKHLGPSAGGLLNATFGNAAELIITIAAVRAGELDVVRASLVGSIVGNILLVFGLSALIGGLHYRVQQFNEEAAGVHTVMMILAVIALFTPAMFVRAAGPGIGLTTRIENLSLCVAAILITVYAAGLVFTFRTHQDVFRAQPDEPAGEPRVWTRRRSYGVLAAATVAIVVESELLVGSISPAVAASGLNRAFVGVIVLPVIGNAAEHVSAVTMAIRNRMDVALSICIGSSTQIALFVAPLIVFLSVPLAHPMPFLFNTYELIAVGFSTLIAAFIARDGRCNWLEGAQLIAVYLILAIAFYFIPR